MKSWSRYGGITFHLMDINCLCYVGLIGFLLIFFHKEVPSWQYLVVAHAAIVAGILELLRLSEKNPPNKVLIIARTFYPGAVILFSWNEMDALVRMLYGTFWATDIIVQLDRVVFGVHPTVWVQQFYRPWLDELMNLAYMCYYTFMPLVTVTLFLQGRQRATIAAISIGIFTYFTNYLLFILFPVLGPHMTNGLAELHTSRFTGYVFAELTRILQANGGVRGGAFPSSHVSAALVWVLVALRFRLRMWVVMMPIALLMAVATVYLGYHHALDPICGLVWGALCYLVSMRLLKNRGELPTVS